MEEAIKIGDTQLVWVETPNNPNWEVTDIEAASKLAHKAEAKLIVDATATPPTMTKSLDLGADISFHSATKYLNGHSDVSAGVLSFKQSNQDWESLYNIRKLQGTVLNSQDAFLLIRGLRTLFLRVDKNSLNAMILAKHFESHDNVETVLYPGLESHPNHIIAKRQTNVALCQVYGLAHTPLVRYDGASSSLALRNLRVLRCLLGGRQAKSEVCYLLCAHGQRRPLRLARYDLDYRR